MNFRNTVMFLAVLAATAVCMAFRHASPVEAKIVQRSTATVPPRFLSELAPPTPLEAGLLQAPATDKKADQAGGLPEGKGKDLTQKNCSTCHATNVFTKQHHTRDQWRSILDNMLEKGLDAPDGDLDIIADYLATNFGPAKSVPQPPSPDASASPAPAPK